MADQTDNLGDDVKGTERRSYGKQVLLSLLAAVAIVAITVVAVTAKLGPTSAAEIDARESIAKERAELEEERLEAAEDRRDR